MVYSASADAEIYDVFDAGVLRGGPSITVPYATRYYHGRARLTMSSMRKTIDNLRIILDGMVNGVGLPIILTIIVWPAGAANAAPL